MISVQIYNKLHPRGVSFLIVYATTCKKMPLKFTKDVSTQLFKYVTTIHLKFNRKSARRIVSKNGCYYYLPSLILILFRLVSRSQSLFNLDFFWFDTVIHLATQQSTIMNQTNNNNQSIKQTIYNKQPSTIAPHRFANYCVNYVPNDLQPPTPNWP